MDTLSAEKVSESVAVVHVGSRLTFKNAQGFTDLWEALIDAGIRHAVLDFSRTGILDSTGLGAVFSLYKSLSTLQGSVRFAAPSNPVLVVMQLARIYKIFPPYPTVEAALCSIQYHLNKDATPVSEREPGRN